ncbi:MAG: NAD-dependent epimerase/dehydratase family protein [Nitratireductor sp.]
MRVAVTGAHGFVGRQICKALKREDHEVIAIVRDAGDTNHIDRLL